MRLASFPGFPLAPAKSKKEEEPGSEASVDIMF